MDSKTKILIVEHDKNDIELMEYELKKGGINCESKIVANEKDYVDALKTFIPDLILSDYSLPSFNGPTALKIREQLAADTPFIFVSGNIGEENSIEYIKRGVTDYVLKDKLFTLVTKVKRALKESKEHREKIKIEQDRLRGEVRLNEAQTTAHLGSWEIDMVRQQQHWSDELFNIFGAPRAETPATRESFLSFVHPEDLNYVRGKMETAFATLEDSSFDFRFIRNGSKRFGECKYRFEFDKKQKPLRLSGIVQDVTEKKLAAAELLTAHERLLFHIENTPLGFIEWDNQRNVKSWSKRAQEIFGWTDKEFIDLQKNGYKMVYEEDQARVSELARQLTSGEVPNNRAQYRNYTKDGTVIWCEWFNSALKDKEGKVITVMSLVQDITERKEAEQRKEFDRNNLYSLINNTNDLMWSVDRDLKLITSNHAFDEMVKYMSGQFPQTGSSVLLDGFSEEQLKRFKLFYERALSGETFTVVEYSKVPVEIWSALSFNPIRKDGMVIGTACFSHDITERRKKEKIIKDERILLKTLIDNLPAIIYTKDIHSKKTLSNRADYEHMGAQSEVDVLGKDDSYFFSDESSRNTIIEEQVIFKTGQAMLGKEDSYENKDGKTWYLNSKIPLRNQEDEIIGLIGIGYDITERKKTEMEIRNLNTELEEKVIHRTAQLEATNKELEGFTYSVSHDLRAPLRIIDGFAQILIDEYSSKLDDEGQRTINVIMNNAQRMGQLIDDLLNFSRLGRTAINKSYVDMGELVNEAVEELKISGISIPQKLTIEEMKPATADANLLKQVWINLISNAIKYSGKKKQPIIEVGMIEEGDKNVYFVKDNGAGFNMKYYQKLFGVFQRLHNQDEFTGTGVGLALVQRIINRHGGMVWAEAAPDEGATFYFSLPVSEKLVEVVAV